MIPLSSPPFLFPLRPYPPALSFSSLASLPTPFHFPSPSPFLSTFPPTPIYLPPPSLLSSTCPCPLSRICLSPPLSHPPSPSPLSSTFPLPLLSTFLPVSFSLIHLPSPSPLFICLPPPLPSPPAVSCGIRGLVVFRDGSACSRDPRSCSRAKSFAFS